MGNKYTNWNAACFLVLGLVLQILSVSTLQAQDWHPFPANGPHLYAFSQQNSADTWYFAAKFDSIVPEGAASAHYFYRMDRFSMPTDAQMTCGGPQLGAIPMAIALECDHYFGKKMTYWPDGVCEFVSSAGDTFRLETRASIGDTWTWKGAVTAQVDSIGFLPVLGVPDSVKYISLSTGEQITLSRAHGFLNVFSFLPFVNFGGLIEYPAFELWGLPAMGLGGRFPGYAEVFDWNPGDHFGHRYSDLSFSAIDSGYFSRVVNAHLPGSRFTYSVMQEQLQFYQYAGQALDTNYVAPAAGTLTFDSLDFLRLGLLPYQHNPAVKTLHGDFCQNGMRTPGINGRMRLDFYKLSFLDSCTNALIPMDDGWLQSFATGLGEIESNYSTIGGFSWRRLYCYEKGTESWGTCLDLSDVVHAEDALVSQFRFGPNPAAETIFLELPVAAKTSVALLLFNASGQFEGKTTLPPGSRTAEIDVSQLPVGLYLLRIEGIGRQVTTLRVAVQR
ncbi:MAG: Secretion system C-terminal sorting domain [Bacteroidota bacterium]|jgi:hypothetical protein